MSFVCVTSHIDGQTLFAAPDTAPNYRGYQHIEECLNAGYRVSLTQKTGLDSIWMDTVIREMKEKLLRDRPNELITRRPKPVIDTINLCLQKFNSDTVKIQTIGKAMRIVRVLLFAHRDEDAVRFAQRFLDSVRNESEKNSDPTIRKKTLSDYKDGLSFMMQQYSSARPVRYDVVKQYYRRILSARAGDSSYYRIDAAVGIIDLAEALGDSVTKEEAAHLALRLNDSIPEEERPKLPNARNRLQSLAGLMVKATKYEALDSIAISTVAFNLWYANTVRRRVYGGPIETRENAQPKKLPELGGAFYYVANNMSPDTVGNGLGSYTRKGAVPANEFPIKHRINYFSSLPGLCYTQTEPRSRVDQAFKQSIFGTGCFGPAVNLRQFKRDYPEIEIIALSATYGTVGHVGPLKPAEEADTLAKLFLGFHHLPIRLVVENTEFFNLAAPDNRRIDLPTPNSEALGISVLNYDLKRMTDKEGYMLMVPSADEAWFKRFYEILRDRKSP